MELLSLCFLFAVLRFVSSNEQYNAKTIVAHSRRLSAASNELGFKLMVELNRQASNNVVFSPISISTTFGLIYLGARNTTEKELEHVLGYNTHNLSKSAVKSAFQHLLANNLVTHAPWLYVLKLANAMFINDKLSLKETYKRNAEEHFLSLVESLSFNERVLESVERINEFVRNKTNNKICNIVDDIDDSVDVIAVNALYFTSKWDSHFPEENTRLGTFYNGRGDSSYVKMMERKDFLPYYEDKEVRLVQLELWGQNISMMIIVPRDIYGLTKYEKTLSHSKLLHYSRNLDFKALYFKLPRFNLSYTSNLNPSFHALGVNELFQHGLANLTGMVHNKNIAVGDVLHKAVVQVDEKGIEASGATAIFSFKSYEGYDDYEDILIVDHPFLFLLLDDRTKLVLFMGRVWNMNE